MKYRETPLRGAVAVDIEPHRDQRGLFARVWCTEEFERHGLPVRFVQASLSRNTRRGTLRGMHMQLPPSREGKLVTCIRGRIYDVIVDLRPDSSTYLEHFGIELDSRAFAALYVPPGMLHGFLTLEDDTDVFYQMTDFHAPALAFGARWNDPTFAIRWPVEEGLTLAERDASYSDFDRSDYEKLAARTVQG